MSIWHTQKVFEINGLYVCRKGRFDGGTGAGERETNVCLGDFYDGFGWHLTFTDPWVYYRNRLPGDVLLSELPAPDWSFRYALEGRQCGASSGNSSTRHRPQPVGHGRQQSGSPPLLWWSAVTTGARLTGGRPTHFLPAIGIRWLPGHPWTRPRSASQSASQSKIIQRPCLAIATITSPFGPPRAATAVRAPSR